MNKTYRYPFKLGYPAIAVMTVVFGLIFYGFFMDAYSSESNGYMMAVLGMLAGFCYILFEGIRNYMSRLTITDEYLVLTKPLTDQIRIRWNDIKEFGR